MINFKEIDIYEWKGKFINHIVNKYNFKNYLELGIGNGDTWNIVKCENKIGVDMDSKFRDLNPNIICSSTDDFFQKNSKLFDVIYIDACHDNNQVRIDFINSLKFIDKNGIILFHDINPLNFAETGPNSSGDVYRFWMLLSDFFDLETILGPHDDALGIFRATNTLTEDHISSILNSTMDYNYSLFEEKRNEIIHKKIISL